MSAEKCPHCGAEQEIPVNIYGYECATSCDGEIQSDLCKERSDHAATKRELEEYRKERQDFIDRDNAMKMAAEDDAAKLRKAEARVAELEAAIELARVGH